MGNKIFVEKEYSDLHIAHVQGTFCQFFENSFLKDFAFGTI